MKITKRLTAMAASAVMAVSSLPITAGMSASASDHNYYEALAMSLYFFDSNACGHGVEIAIHTMLRLPSVHLTAHLNLS